MSASWERLDESSYRPRANPRGTRPRTKRRPSHEDAVPGHVTGVHRGRYSVMLGQEDGSDAFEEAGREVLCMKARELGRQGVVVGDRVRVEGDLSGRRDTLARIVSVARRSTELRRSSDEAEGADKVVVANADQLVITAALANPPLRTGLIDRYIAAAFDAGMDVLLCLTKSDLVDETAPGPTEAEVEALYQPLGLRVFTLGQDGRGQLDPAKLAALKECLVGHTSVLAGHSGVGKSTLINALVPQAERPTGSVNAVTGRGRHTSPSAVSLALEEGGWIIDTPGVRSFGLAHVGNDRILDAFEDMSAAAELCPPNGTHAESEPSCALDAWADEDDSAVRHARLDSLRRLIPRRAAEI